MPDSFQLVYCWNYQHAYRVTTSWVQKSLRMAYFQSGRWSAWYATECVRCICQWRFFLSVPVFLFDVILLRVLSIITIFVFGINCIYEYLDPIFQDSFSLNWVLWLAGENRDVVWMHQWLLWLTIPRVQRDTPTTTMYVPIYCHSFLLTLICLWVVINCYLLGYKVDKIHLNSILISTFVDLSIFVLWVFLISL
jgi:hypothetical protein